MFVRRPETKEPRPASRSDFLDALIAGVEAAGLGWFLPGRPRRTVRRAAARTEADTERARKLYQAMLDITGH
jgi:hypothetical protein